MAPLLHKAAINRPNEKPTDFFLYHESAVLACVSADTSVYNAKY